jgi:hypothetical protein
MQRAILLLLVRLLFDSTITLTYISSQTKKTRRGGKKNKSGRRGRKDV